MDFPSLLKLCGKQRLLAQGLMIHTYILCNSGIEQSILLKNLLMHMYASCGAMEEAVSIFHSHGTTPPNLFSFSIMIGSYVDHGCPMEAHSLFHKVQPRGFIPDQVMFVNLLSLCCGREHLSFGRILHVQMMYCGVLDPMNVVVGTALITMYSKCGDIPEAKNAFECMVEQRNVVSWNALIGAYVEHGQVDIALCLYEQMIVEGIVPDRVTFLTVLPIFSALADAQQCHASLIGSGIYPHISISSSLIHVYGKCGCLDDASRAFDEAPGRNLVCWNAYINACVHNPSYCTHSNVSRHGGMQLLLVQMQQEGVMPDEISFLGGLALSGTLWEVKEIHVSISSSGYLTDHQVLAAALLKAYRECQITRDDAWVIAVNEQQQQQQQQQQPKCWNLVLWNGVLRASIEHGEWSESLQLFKQLHLECHIPDKVTYTTMLSGCANRADQVGLIEGNRLHVCLTSFGIEAHARNSLLNMYAKCGHLGLAWEQFECNTAEQSVVCWNSMICGGISLLEPGEVCSQPFRLAQQMVCQGTMPSHVTYAALFTSCSNTLAQDDGVRLHSRISGTSIEADTVVGNALIHMYGKCGGLKEAKLAFLRIRKRSLITWNAMIGAFCQHGHVQDVVGILKEMQMDGIAPDEVTYFNVLSVCSHCGIVDQGFQYFFFMCYNHNIIPCIEHFNCLFGLLGRAGRLDEGEEIIRNMPFTKRLNSWMPLLIACCNIHSDSIRGKRLADLAFQLEPNTAASYVTLANVYAMGD